MVVSSAIGFGAVAAYCAAALVIAAAVFILARFAIRSSKSLRKGYDSCESAGADACACCPKVDGCASRSGGENHDSG